PRSSDLGRIGGHHCRALAQGWVTPCERGPPPVTHLRRAPKLLRRAHPKGQMASLVHQSKEEKMNTPVKTLLLVLRAVSLGGFVGLKTAHAGSAPADLGSGSIDLADKGHDGGMIEMSEKADGGGWVALSDKHEGGSVELSNKHEGGSVELSDKHEGGS